MSNTHARCPAGGFTLIELAVVILVIGLLIGLLLPAVQGSREAARMATCRMNLKQVALGMNAYAGSVGGLPLVSNGKNGFSSISMMLPYIEQRQLFDAINFKVFHMEPHNQTVARITIATLLCPSDSGMDALPACTNYAANCGYGYQMFHKYNGPFGKGVDRSISFAAITDGTTNTALMAEWVLGPSVYKQKDRLGSAFVAQRMKDRKQFMQFVSQCSNLNVDGSTRFMNTKGKPWLQGAQSSSAYNHNITPNGLSCYNGTGIIDGAWTAGSRHGGIAHIAFVDGHVKVMRDSVALAVWRAIATRSGAEIEKPPDD